MTFPRALLGALFATLLLELPAPPARAQETGQAPGATPTADGVRYVDPKALVGSLTIAKQQMVEIAKALSFESRILIMDEPTAALGVPEQRKVMALIRRLKERNVGVLFISHNLADIFEVSDRILVLRRGKKAGERMISETDSDEVVKLMVGG